MNLNSISNLRQLLCPLVYRWYYHQTTFLQLTTFLKSHLASSILPQTSYFFLWYFCLDVLFTNMNFSRFLLLWQYTLWKLLLDLEGTWHNSVSNTLLKLYSYYFIGCPICYIQVLGEVRAKLPELKIFKERWGIQLCLWVHGKLCPNCEVGLESELSSVWHAEQRSSRWVGGNFAQRFIHMQLWETNR